MRSRIFMGLILGTLLLVTLAPMQPVLAAGPTGRYDILTFPDCASFSLESSQGVLQPGPSFYTETMTDGNGTVIFSRSKQGGSFSTLLYAWTFNKPFTVQPKANPIHELIVMDGVVIADVFANSPCLGGPQFAGPSAPSSFVLRTITCDTPIYQTAGGSPLGTGDLIKAGQTWFINPTPVKVRGIRWTEIFAGGYSRGFIRTKCVGAKPAGYGGN